MIKAMVIEDRILTLNALKSQVPWQENNIEPVGFYTNCKEAMANIEKQQPDVIVSDIVMPGMDGLSFCEYVNSLNRNIKIIIISAYSKFEYAKKGIQLGVYDFLEKPVDYELLCSRVVQAGKEKQHEQQVEKLYASNQDMYIESLFLSLIKNDGLTKKEKTEELKNILQIDLENMQFNSIMIAVEFASEKGEVKEICESVKDRLAETCQEEIWGPFLYQASTYCLILGKKENCIAQMLEENLKQSIAILIRSHPNVHINIGIGYWTDSADKIQDSAESAAEVLEYRFVFGKNDVFNICDYEDKKLEDYTGFEVFERQLTESIDSGDSDRIKKLCADMGEYAEDHHINKSYLDFFITDFLSARLRRTSSEADIHKEDYLPKLRKTRYAREVLDCFSEILVTECESRRRKPATDAENAAEKIKKYIEDNFRKENLSLGEISRIFSMSPNYICRIFKEKTGTTLLNYINNLKILEAKKMLVQTDKKIWEISQELGYSNQYYFSMGFKKATGYSPKEYRKQS